MFRKEDDPILFSQHDPVWICYSSGFQVGWVVEPIEHKEFHHPHHKFYFYKVLMEDGTERNVPQSRLMDREN